MKIPPNLVKPLKAAQHIAILTGAGISAESGIPTFREAQTGLWAKYNPEELATSHAFKANPLLVLNWYKWRRSITSRAKPNSGHFALAKMESIAKVIGFQFTLITQNIDGLHQRAGNSRDMIELHGNINRAKCSQCGRLTELDTQTVEDSLHCKLCTGFLRPDVVWFGENIPVGALQAAWDAAKTCDVFLAIGTSAIVQPAAHLPVISLQNGATVVEINPDETPFSQYASFKLQGPSGIILPNLIDAVSPDFK